MPDFSEKGGSLRRMAELHIIEARRHAFDLFTLTSTIYPDEWTVSVAEKIVNSTFEFACHTYRINELLEFDKNKFYGASASRYIVKDIDLKLEDNYLFAIHKIRHAKDLVLGWAKFDKSTVYLSSTGQCVAQYLTLKGSNHPGNISLFGVSFVFLTSVIQSIKVDFPELQF